MRKTKIICTLGPSTDQEGVLRELVANGMNVARFNFSHGSHEEHLGRFEKLKAIREELGLPVAALLDTKGPEIRLRDFKNGTEMLEAGQTFTLTTREVEGTKEICSITYKDLPQDVQPGGTIMLDDGLIKLQIQTVNDTDIVCKVLNNGKIKNKKGVNVPGVHLSMPYMSQRDKDDIIFGIQQGFDFIAASFVRTAQDVYDIRNLLNQYDSNIRIIAATNRNLAERVEKGLFRRDLYYRLNVAVVNIPPLRERPDDIQPLVTHFLNMFTSKYRKHMNLTPGLMEALRQYSWPGNVRELHNFLDRYTAFGDVALESLGDAGKTELLFPALHHEGLTLETATLQLEERLIRQALERCRWRRGDAAEALGLNLRTLQRKMKRLGMGR